ncbi:MAG: MerR family DNA-binding transcriptional regulator [Bacilli bacterium]
MSRAAKVLDVTVKTIQRWDREGRLVRAGRTASHRRVYTESQSQEFFGLRRCGASEIATRQVAYCRISSVARRLDLQNQRRLKDRLTRFGFGWVGHDAM